MLVPHFWLALVLSYLLIPVLGKRSLSATSLVTCSDSSLVTPSYFNVTFDPDDLSLRYNIDLVTELSGYVTAHVAVYAYGFQIINQDIDLCDLGWKQFCPVFPGSLQINSIQYISNSTADLIPGIAYQVPDIDAVVRVEVVNGTSGEQLTCLQASFSNGKTVSQTGVKWATAVISGLGLLIGAVLSTFGNSNAASFVSANVVSLFLYFQSVVIVSMQGVERVPPIASAWAENLAWSMGLIEVEFMQKIFRWYIQATGGSPTLYFLNQTKQILVQRAYDYLDNLHNYAAKHTDLFKRAPDFSLSSNAFLIILRGIERIGFNSHIEPTSIVVTGFTFFVIVGYILMVVVFLFKAAVDLLIRFRKINPNRFSNFRRSFGSIIKGTLLRYIFIGFLQISVFSLWEFTRNDSPAVIVLAVLFLLLILSVICWSLYRTILVGRKSVEQFNNPAALLYGDSRILNKYGFCYTMFSASKYWFGVVIVAYNLVKGIFIGLCQASGKASSLVIFILDLAFTIYLFISAPYLNKPTNILNFVMSIVTTLNSFFFLFFSDLFGQPAPVAAIMAWVFFILNAAFAFVLLITIIVFSVMSMTSKNPDARFAPAKDDRTSFQRMASIRRARNDVKAAVPGSNELLALGAAAQHHDTDWEEQMYKMNDDSSIKSYDNNQNIFTPEINQEKFSDNDESDTPVNETTDSEDLKHSLGSKLKSLRRGFSTKSRGGEATEEKNLTRFSDALDDDISEVHPEPNLDHNRSESAYSGFIKEPTQSKKLV